MKAYERLVALSGHDDENELIYLTPSDMGAIVEIESLVCLSAGCTLAKVPGKQNWVEENGGLPGPICEMAKDISEERGIPVGNAIAIAVSQAKKLAAKGNAKYAAAVAEWEKMKAKAHAKD